MPSVAEATVSASARFLRSLRSLGMTYFIRVCGGLYGLTLFPQAYTRPATVITSEGAAVAWQSHWRDAAARSAVKTVLG